MAPFDFLLWGFVNDTAFLSPLRTENMNLKREFIEAVTLIAGNMLINIREELVYKNRPVPCESCAHTERL
jgi:hypothetical protein